MKGRSGDTGLWGVNKITQASSHLEKSEFGHWPHLRGH